VHPAPIIKAAKAIRIRDIASILSRLDDKYRTGSVKAS
jgi:hypothetical protein